MVGPHDEPPLAPQAVGDLRQEARGRLLDGAAHLADEVLVEVVGQVVHGPAVAEVDVLYQPRFLQGLERAVHGGPVHAWVRPVD